MNQNLGLSQTATYQICIQGGLDDRWAGWFEGMTLVRDDARHMTILTGAVPDQAALHGLLARIRDLGLPLLSLTCVDPGWEPLESGGCPSSLQYSSESSRPLNNRTLSVMSGAPPGPPRPPRGRQNLIPRCAVPRSLPASGWV